MSGQAGLAAIMVINDGVDSLYYTYTHYQDNTDSISKVNEKWTKLLLSGLNSRPKVDEYLKYAGVSSPNTWCGAFVIAV